MSTDTNSPPGNGRHRSAHRHATPAAAGRVRWKRFAIMFIPAAGVSAALLVATANGALAASFSISGQRGETSADSLTGQGFEQFGTADVANPLNGNALQPVVESEISSAQITNLCQSLAETIPGLGTFTLKITGGDNGTPATASSLIIDANQLSGSTATFNNIQQGIDNSQLKVATPTLAGHGNYAQQATSVTITNLQEVAYSTEAGTFTLPGFNLSLTAGNNPCFSGPNEPDPNQFHL
ncbi:MAG: cholesterol esterase [Actinobacteria bacterium]|nr:cholesterol esterase [Actinomycetota bacterium]